MIHTQSTHQCLPWSLITVITATVSIILSRKHVAKHVLIWLVWWSTVLSLHLHERQELFTDPALALHLAHLTNAKSLNLVIITSALERNSNRVLGKAKTLLPRGILTQIWIYSIFLYNNSCRTHTHTHTLHKWVVCSSLRAMKDFNHCIHLLWLYLEQHREIILLGQYHYLLKKIGRKSAIEH